MLEALKDIDQQLFYMVNQGMESAFLDKVCPYIRNPKFMAGIYVIIAVRILQLYPKQFLYIALAAGLTFLITDQVSSSVIKPMYHRLRPCNIPGNEVRLLLDHCGSGFSLPSSHAANTFGMAMFLTLVVRRTVISVFMLVWASTVAFSQVYVGVHFPGDVAAGALLGIVAATITALIFNRVNPLQQ